MADPVDTEGGSSGNAEPASTTVGDTDGDTDGGTSALDPGRIPWRRLNNREYDRTIGDLLGIDERRARSSFIPDEEAEGFDNLAAALGMTSARYEGYFDAAETLSRRVMVDPALRSRVVSCPPPTTSALERSCVQTMLETFGLRVWRRPLEAAEASRLEQVFSDARALGASFDEAMGDVLTGLLAAPGFLYRFEEDPSPTSGRPHLVDAYAMASRLSYLVWSTMPDDRLFELAGDGTLLDEEVVVRELDRLVASERSMAFIEDFAGQWLGARALASHQVNQDIYPDFNAQLRDAMIREVYLYVGDFVGGGRAFRDFLTTDVNFVDSRLAALYGISPGKAAFDPVVDASDDRRGFLGLAAFLTTTSFSYRTSPTLRGKWILENLLCRGVAAPPANVEALDDKNDPPATSAAQNVRERLEVHRTDPNCASCHKVLDPIGLGLEHFDAIGRYRAAYPNGDAIDASGTLPGNRAFGGLGDLGELLSEDTALVDCASKRLFTYALSRAPRGGDMEHLDQLRRAWAEGGDPSLAGLLTTIVRSPAFRYRRGEPAVGEGP